MTKIRDTANFVFLSPAPPPAPPCPPQPFLLSVGPALQPSQPGCTAPTCSCYLPAFTCQALPPSLGWAELYPMELELSWDYQKISSNLAGSGPSCTLWLQFQSQGPAFHLSRIFCTQGINLYQWASQQMPCTEC